MWGNSVWRALQENEAGQLATGAPPEPKGAMRAAEDARDHGPRKSENHRLHEVASFRIICMSLCGEGRPSTVQKPVECATCAPAYFPETVAESWGMTQGPPSPS